MGPAVARRGNFRGPDNVAHTVFLWHISWQIRQSGPFLQARPMASEADLSKMLMSILAAQAHRQRSREGHQRHENDRQHQRPAFDCTKTKEYQHHGQQEDKHGGVAGLHN